MSMRSPEARSLSIKRFRIGQKLVQLRVEARHTQQVSFNANL